MLLLVDNYDSFTWNLAHLFAELGVEVVVKRNDEVDADAAERLAPSHLVLSPGPGRPSDTGASRAILERLAGQVPVLGVCLGHQLIVEAYGGGVGEARSLLHGKATAIRHDGAGVYEELAQDVEVGRYHSLGATAVPAALHVSATAPDGEVMGVRHRELRVEGVQFHPESVLTPDGRSMAAAFLRL